MYIYIYILVCTRRIMRRSLSCLPPAASRQQWCYCQQQHSAAALQSPVTEVVCRVSKIRAERFQNRFSENPESILGASKIDPRRVQKLLQTVLEGPEISQTPSGGSRSLPRAPWERPRYSQEPPKSLPKAPKSAPRAPNSAQERPKRPPGELSDTILRSPCSKKQPFASELLRDSLTKRFRKSFSIEFSLVRESVEPQSDSPIPSRNEVRLFCERVDPLERNSIAKAIRSTPERD